jgi:cell division protein FtsB
MKRFLSTTNFPGPEERSRIFAEKAPRAEAFAASWIERWRPAAAGIYGLRRRIATAAIAVVTGLLLVHVMFGANGMIVYKQKRSEYQALQKQLARVREENEKVTQHIQGLQSDQKAIEKEAREQLGYAKPGEYVYVAPAPAKPSEPPANHSARK